MKRKIKTIVLSGILLGVSLLLSDGMGIAAKAQEGDVEVSFTAPGEAQARYRQTVKIQGKGVVYDGDQELAAEGLIYELLPGEEKVYRAAPKKGNYLKSVTYDGENVTEQMDKSGYITITQKAKDTVLTFTFGEKAQMITDKTVNKRTYWKGVLTGDSTAMTAGVIFFITAGVICLILRSRRRIR